MVRVKMLKNNEVAVIDNGKSYVFDNRGIISKEDAGLIPQYTTGMTALPIISVLSSNNQVEIALIDNDNMTVITPKDDAMTCAMKIQMQKEIVRILRRDGVSNDTRFNQLIFIYKEGTKLQNKVKEIVQ